MSVIIYTYRDPYKLKENKELWKEISSCPYFCVAQTLVNGLKAVYGAAFQIGRVTTVKNLTDILYEKWNGTACAVKQHADIDNIIVNSSDITGISGIELDNVKKSFLFNRDEVFTSIRTMFELKMEPQNIVDKYLTPEQRFIVSVYKKIRASEKSKNFCLEQDFTEEQINQAITKAMITAKDNSSTKNEIEVETLDVTQEDATERLHSLIKKLGGMDLFLLSSGVGHQNMELNADIELNTARTNVDGFIRMVTAAFQYFRQQGNGHLAVISSIAGTKGLGVAPAYSATKRFQNTYIDALEQLSHLQKLHIRFTDIRPGFVATDLLNDGKHYPLLMDAAEVGRHISWSLKRKQRVAVIDWRYRILVFFWKMIPRWMWKRLPVKTN